MPLIASHSIAQLMAWLTQANASSLPCQLQNISEKQIDTFFIDWAYNTQPLAKVWQAGCCLFLQICVAVIIIVTIDNEQGRWVDRCGSFFTTTWESWKRSDAMTQQDLGFPGVIQDLETGSTTITGNTKDALECKELAGEILELLQ